jgi:hypothetical protein
MIGLLAALWYHFCNGIRHLFWDAGYGYEIGIAEQSGLRDHGRHRGADGRHPDRGLRLRSGSMSYKTDRARAVGLGPPRAASGTGGASA